MRKAHRPTLLASITTAAALAVVAAACSPTSPSSQEVAESGDMVWIDPAGREMFVHVGGSLIDLRFVKLTSATRFLGATSSAQGLVATYRAGNRIWVDVTGTPIADRMPDPDLVGTTVTVVLRGTQIVHLERRGYSYYPRLPSRILGLSKSSYFIMPWTTFDPSGDITTYEAFLVAVATSERAHFEGDGWLVGEVAYHMRRVKLTRTDEER